MIALRRSLSFVFCFLTVLPALGGELRYTVTDLGVPLPGFELTYAEAVNNLGETVFTSALPPKAWPPIYASFLRDDAGLRRIVSDFTLSAEARDINDVGQIAGTITYRSAFLWDSGRLRMLPPLPGGSSSWSSGLNNRGQVVGGSTVADPRRIRAVRWEPDGTPVDLGAAPFESSVAVAINEQGHAVGYGNGVPLLWADGQMIELPMPPGAFDAQPADVNDRGEIVGMTTSLGIRAVHWSDGSARVLSTPNGYASAANAINNAGDIVGYNSGFSVGVRGALWRDGVRRELTDLLATPGGWMITYAADINDAGWILADAELDGVSHAVLLKPVPEPASVVLIGAGCLALLSRRWRRGRLTKPAR
jgi:hypothetical protein